MITGATVGVTTSGAVSLATTQACAIIGLSRLLGLSAHVYSESLNFICLTNTTLVLLARTLASPGNCLYVHLAFNDAEQCRGDAILELTFRSPCLNIQPQLLKQQRATVNAASADRLPP